MPGSLAIIEHQLRRSVEQQHFDATDRLVALLCLETGDYLKSLPVGSPEGQSVCQRLLDTIEWTRLMTCTVRARLADELQRLPALNRYLGALEIPSHQLKLDL